MTAPLFFFLCTVVVKIREVSENPDFAGTCPKSRFVGQVNIRKQLPTLRYRSLVTHSNHRLFPFYPLCESGNNTPLAWRSDELLRDRHSVLQQGIFTSECRSLKFRNQIRNLLRLIIWPMYLR